MKDYKFARIQNPSSQNFEPTGGRPDIISSDLDAVLSACAPDPLTLAFYYARLRIGTEFDKFEPYDEKKKIYIKTASGEKKQQIVTVKEYRKVSFSYSMQEFKRLLYPFVLSHLLNRCECPLEMAKVLADSTNTAEKLADGIGEYLARYDLYKPDWHIHPYFKHICKVDTFRRKYKGVVLACCKELHEKYRVLSEKVDELTNDE